MKPAVPTFFALALGLSVASCGGNAASEADKSASATAASAEAGSRNDLVSNPPQQPAGTFTRQDFEGIGTIELPGGPDWKEEDGALYNAKLDMTIVVQSQPEGMQGAEKEYLDSYNDVNVRDAPGWQRGKEELGEVHGLKAARTEGRFNNGTAMVTRDYIFFDQGKTVLLQARAGAANAAALTQTIDYIAASFQKKA